MAKASKQCEVVAVEKGAKARYEEAKTIAYQRLQKGDLLCGLARRYEPRDEEGEQLPPERSHVQVRAEEVLTEVSSASVALFDVVATKDWGNTVAKADVEVEQAVLVKDAPVTYLLWLEKQLVDLNTIVEKLPILDATEQWVFDQNQNCYVTEPVQKVRSVRVKRPIVLYDATPEHPAQTAIVEEDKAVGTWTTVKYSGAMPVARVKQLKERLGLLSDAVKVAREKANATQVETKEVGARVLSWLFRS